MGIFNALTTAVSGLNAQSFALENISGNIANSQTTGFKRSDTSFADLVTDGGTATAQRAGSVRPLTRSTNSVAGGIQSSDIATNMAISGDGYFILGEKTGTIDNKPIFSSQSLYTRRGDFSLDKNGYLVNGAGYYLKALPIDATTGNPSSSTPTPIQFTNDFLPAKGTQTITYRANLPQFPLTQNADVSVPNSELLPSSVGITPGVTGTDSSTFLANSISGGAVTSYDANGNPVSVQLRWAKTANTAASAGPPAVPASTTWNLFYQQNSNATGSTIAYANVGTAFKFDTSGQLSPAMSSLTISNLTVNGTTVGNVKLDLGTKGLTQYADSNGSVQVNTVSQDGYAAGQVTGVTVNDGGHIVAKYSNGQSLEVGRVILAAFNGQDSLTKVDGGAFAESDASGAALLGAPGQISGSSNEGSNTDIASEFSKLIVTQQAYSSNTRIITTANQMLQDTLSMVR